MSLQPGDIGFRPKSYSRTTNDVAGDSPVTARFIGNLRPDVTRLNVFSALTRNDRVDHFFFRVTEAGKVGLGLTGGDQVRVEVMERRSGRMIADSTASFGERKDNWDKLAESKFELKAQEYVLRVTRQNTVSRSESPNYGIQLTIGDATKIREDYDTLERPQARASASVAPAANMTVNLLSGGGRDSNGFLNIFV